MNLNIRIYWKNR